MTTLPATSSGPDLLGVGEGRPLLIKVCGLTDPGEAAAVAAAGADYIGLNFHPGSPRYVAPELAAAIVAALPDSTVPVGLFVDRPPAEVAEVAMRVGLRVVQLHGDEPPASLAALSDLLIVKAFRIGSAEGLAAMQAYLDEADRIGRPPDAVLVDAHVPGLVGGTGRTIDDGVMAGLPGHPRLILAGGLTPENLRERLAILGAAPWMVDVASGVESSPGRKDLERVTAFVKAARPG